MQCCSKYETKISGCSKQVSLFAPKLCERCLEEKTWLIGPRKAESVIHWKEEFGTETGMPKEEAFEKFLEWKDSKKTCTRCEEKQYTRYCPVHLICKQADEEEVVKNVGDAKGNDNRTRVNEADGSQTLRAKLSQARKRNAIR